MITTRALYLLGLLILFTLLIRDLPYVNVAIINRMWIVYLVILLVTVLSSLKFRYAPVLLVTCALFFIAYILTILSIVFVADAIGILIYFSIWILLIHLIVTTFRE